MPNSSAELAVVSASSCETPINLQGSRRAAAMNPLQERQRHLAYRTGRFEESQQHRTLGEKFVQCPAAVLQAL